jgi:hypothetical protein
MKKVRKAVFVYGRDLRSLNIGCAELACNEDGFAQGEKI